VIQELQNVEIQRFHRFPAYGRNFRRASSVILAADGNVSGLVRRPAQAGQGSDAPRGPGAPGGRRAAGRCPREERMGRRPPARRGIRAEELPRAVGRGPAAEQGQAHHPLLRGRGALGHGGGCAAEARLHERDLHVRRIQPLEGLRPPVDQAGDARTRSSPAVLTPPPHPRGRWAWPA